MHRYVLLYNPATPQSVPRKKNAIADREKQTQIKSCLRKSLPYGM
jgi:hypothetical protein